MALEVWPGIIILLKVGQAEHLFLVNLLLVFTRQADQAGKIVEGPLHISLVVQCRTAKEALLILDPANAHTGLLLVLIVINDFWSFS